MKHGNLNPSAPQGKPKADGGSSFGKNAKFKAPKAAELTKSKGRPADKGVNR